MTQKASIIGVCIFAVVWGLLLPTRLILPLTDTFAGDADAYNRGAIHLSQSGFYSHDGVTPSLEREPGMSAFLAVIYVVFGAENRIAVFIIQALFYLIAAIVFCRALRRHTSERSVLITFFLLILLPSIYHTLFSVYRENFTLSLLLLLSAAFLYGSSYKYSLFLSLGMGVLLGVIILTYIPFIFLPLFIVVLSFFLRLPKRHCLILLIVPYIVVSLWGFRNLTETGTFRIAGGERSAYMWYIRGEQAEHVRGVEPFMCLWAEYISRDWTERSPYCSFNGVMHRRWPDGEPVGDTSAISWEAQRKILKHFPQYLWFSIFEILELHLPYVNGWGLSYNILAALSTMILYLGCLFSIPHIWRKEFALCIVLILYSTAVFTLTDATPRYLIPVIFCYAVLAGVGYDAAWSRLKRT